MSFLSFLGGVGSLIAPGLFAGSQIKAQGRENMKLAQFQAEANERYLQQQLEYNTPANQMKRFQDAGLNPHLIYGQGNPGNQSAPLTHPEIKTRDFGALMQMLPQMNQSLLTQSQVQATNAKTMQTGVLADLQRQQTELIKRNPLFSDSYLNSMVDSFKSMASIKASEAWRAGNLVNFEQTQGFGKYGGSPNIGQEKMWRELELLDQKWHLGDADNKLKAEVLQTKEFQNDILNIQRKWMVDGEITPQLIYQFLSSFFLKLTP